MSEVGKVVFIKHTNRERSTQHYLVSSWRGVSFRLTGNAAYTPRGILVAEGKSADGISVWADEDGNYWKADAIGEHRAINCDLRNPFTVPVPRLT
ncbi:hypothetical protein [Mesorhizobium sp. M8A.F.Ca.ET.021.01.1.1]|uniref:hypothetical protein n=1 Tax=Mesorhizobium sp. M8A.F.Ca.ET.021.01.1.1 TaxID=2496757 RepID=UPI000FCA30B2|nr:hypothetical protein [Mesorhizobium sp. M8A.F.Ca.ET.021.01.1.1]RUW56372.1 hypothetical protein EOA36_04495 [Mesorhizobium sp. M8A.F.Ca.ET.021.01.1.1]